jgi:formate dehydrogenase subunit gamma
VATSVDRGPRPNSRVANLPDEILRFQVCERHLHWAIAIPFKVCYLTAVILVTVYNPAPNRPYRDVFAWTHRLSGICLATLPALALFIHRREFGMHLRNIREAWSWRFEDLKWLALMGPSTVSKRVTLPDQGKFNAAEKINFIVVMSTYPLYIATGLTIWFLRPAYMAWMVHFAMATAATPLVLGHIFMATVNPDTRVGLTGMISGWVSREWARHHYRHWYDEHFGHHERTVPASAGLEPPAPALPAASVAPAAPALPAIAAAQVARRPAAAALPAVPRQAALAPPGPSRPLVPAGASAIGEPSASRPVTVLWPPGASGADPSFAS